MCKFQQYGSVDKHQCVSVSRWIMSQTCLHRICFPGMKLFSRKYTILSNTCISKSEVLDTGQTLWDGKFIRCLSQTVTLNHCNGSYTSMAFTMPSAIHSSICKQSGSEHTICLVRLSPKKAFNSREDLKTCKMDGFRDILKGKKAISCVKSM